MNPLIASIIKISKQYPIQKIILFGSRARGDHSKKSDYDIALISSALTPVTKSKITEYMDNLDTFHKIDLVFLKDLQGTDALTQNIIKDGVTLMNKFQLKFQNYQNALTRLEESIHDFEELQNLTVRDGVIQRFEFTTELAWKTIREYLISEQVSDINTPKSVMREAFSTNIITNEEGWLQILNDRNATSHIYDESEADEIFSRIQDQHVILFQELKTVLSKV